MTPPSISPEGGGGVNGFLGGAKNGEKSMTDRMSHGKMGARKWPTLVNIL